MDSDAAQAEVFMEFFKSVFRDDSGVTAPETVQLDTQMDPVHFTQEEVLRELLRLDVNKGYGADGIHPRILRAISHFVASPLSGLFNLSLTTSIVPPDWRSWIINPIFKKGNRECAANCRPVSLTSVV